MWKKPALCMLVLALGGAIAFVNAQDENRPPSRLPTNAARPLSSASSRTDEPLSNQLRSAGRSIVAEYNQRATESSPPPAVPSRSTNSIVRTGSTAPSQNSTIPNRPVGAYQDQSSGEPEVPAILSGRDQTPVSNPANSTSEEESSGADAGSDQDETEEGSPGARLLAPPINNARPLNPPSGQGLRIGDTPSVEREQTSENTVAPQIPTQTNQNDSGSSSAYVPSQGIGERGYGGNSQPGLQSPQNPARTETTESTATPTIPASTGSSTANALPSNGLTPTNPASSVAATPSQPTMIALESLGPQLHISASGPNVLKVGKSADYQLRVRNLANVAANDATISIALPEWVTLVDSTSTLGQTEVVNELGVRRLEWKVSQIDAVGMCEANLELLVTENRPFELQCSWSAAPVSTSRMISVTQPNIRVNIVGPSSVIYGDKASFEISIVNDGNGDAENVLLTLPASLGGRQSELGLIEANSTKSFQVEVTAQQEEQLRISANVTADGGIVETANHVVDIRRANLDIQIDAPRFKFAGTTAEYRITVQNVGDATAKDVIGAIALPTGSVYLGGIEDAEAVEEGLRWAIGELAPSAQLQYTIVCELNQAGTAHIEAGIRDITQLMAADVADTMVEAIAELVIEVDDPKGPIAVGEEAVYAIKVFNRGTKEAVDVHLVAQFSEGIEPTAGLGRASEIEDGQVIFQGIPRIGPGEEMEFQVKAIASLAGNHVFRAHLTCDNPDTHRVFEGTTRYFDLSGFQSNGLSTPSNGLTNPSNGPSLQSPRQ